MVQIAEGTLDEVTTILQRMRDLAVQAANGSLTTVEQGYLDTEHSKLATTLGAVIDQSQFNGTDLVSDTAQTSVTIQSGADAGETTSINFKALTENLLAVSASEVDLAGTSQGKEAQLVTGVAVATNSATHTVTINGVLYTGAAADLADGDALASNLADATADDGTVLSSLYNVSASANGNQATAITLQFQTKVNGNNPAADYTVSTVESSPSGFAAGSLGTNTAGTSTAQDAISAIDTALATVASERAVLGATQAQLESTVRNLANVAENTSAAAGRIMDTDYAAETANLTKAQILQQAATSILAQANAQPQAVLSLLQ
jgi:flagellin